MSPRLASAITSNPAARALASDLGERLPAGRTKPLEAGELWLDGHALVRDRVDHQRAMRRDGTRGSDGGWGGRIVHPTHKFERMRPQQRRIRVEAEHELRLTPRHGLGQPVPKTADRHGDCGCSVSA